MVWKPHVTVAAVVERDDRFLIVEEESAGQIVFNQPSGHLEPNESLVDACVRETLEETRWLVEPLGVIGVYRWTHPVRSQTTMRVCFAARALSCDPTQPLDSGILDAVWLTREELLQNPTKLRSKLVMRCVDDYCSGANFPLSMLADIAES